MNDFFKFYSGSLSGTIIVIILFLFIRFLLKKYRLRERLS